MSAIHLPTARPRLGIWFSPPIWEESCPDRRHALTFAQNCACDTQGNTYVTGATTVSDLPVTPNAFQPGPAPGSTQSAFVAKYDPNGQPLWCTYLGGDNQSMGIGVAAMPNGGVVVVGSPLRMPRDHSPPPNAYQGQNNGQSDYFVTVFDANGNPNTRRTWAAAGWRDGDWTDEQIPFADDQNNGNCVAVDAAGLVYVAGMTTSGGGSGATQFPVTANALQSNLGGTKTPACASSTLPRAAPTR